MVKKLFLGVMFAAFISASIGLVSLANDTQMLRELRWQLAQQNLRPVPPEVLAMPTPMPPLPKPPLPHPYPIRPRFTGPCRDDPELFTYIAERREALTEVVPWGELGLAFVTVNFKRPLGQAELDQLRSVYGLRLFNIRYVTNTDVSGGCGQCNLSEVETWLRSQHGDLIKVEGAVSAQAAGPLEDIQRLGEHPEVLLVDLAEIEEFAPGKPRANFPVEIFWRYERACH